MRRILCRWLIGACCVALPIVARAQVPQQLQAAEVLIARIEAAIDDAAEFDLVAERPALDSALATIREYLSANPEDAGALILSVRLGRVREVFIVAEKLAAKLVEDPGAGAPEPVSFAAYQRVLDGALARDSTVAAAHYWKAVLLRDEADLAQVAEVFDEAEPPRGPSRAPGVAAAAEGHLRQAVAHDPGNVGYGESLARLLVERDAFDAADELLSHLTTAGTGLHLLVRDLRAVGAPPAAEIDEALAGVALMTGLAFTANTGEPWRARELLVRLRAWTTSASLAEVQAFYRARWPGLFFGGDEEGLWITGALLWRDGGWRAAETLPPVLELAIRTRHCHGSSLGESARWRHRPRAVIMAAALLCAAAGTAGGQDARLAGPLREVEPEVARADHRDHHRRQAPGSLMRSVSRSTGGARALVASPDDWTGGWVPGVSRCVGVGEDPPS